MFVFSDFLAWLWGVALFTIAGPSEIGVCVLLIQIAFKLGVLSACAQSAMSSPDAFIFDAPARLGVCARCSSRLTRLALGVVHSHRPVQSSLPASIFAWDPVMRFVCFLCGIRFSEH